MAQSYNTFILLSVVFIHETNRFFSESEDQSRSRATRSTRVCATRFPSIFSFHGYVYSYLALLYREWEMKTFLHCRGGSC